MLSDSRKSFPKRQMTVVDPASRLRAAVFFGEEKELDRVEGVILDLPLSLDVGGDVAVNKTLPHAKKQSLLQIAFKDLLGGAKKASFKALKKKLGKGPGPRETRLSVRGSWISSLQIDSKEFWTPERRKFACKLVRDPLPSDTRFREDILWLRQGNHAQSQKWKLKIEAAMRAERTNRARADL